jgi:26S proteasome regulatory subunit T4
LQVIELPLLNPELFQRVGITPPKGCLLYGPPGTGKTLLARAVASQLDANFLKVVSSAIVDKYIGESARLIREMFNYARDHQPCIIFMDEIDAIGKRNTQLDAKVIGRGNSDNLLFFECWID